MLQIDLEHKNIRRGKTILMEHGIPKNDFQLPQEPVSWETLDNLYQEYKHSVPSSQKKGRSPFYALPEDELSFNDLVTGKPRGEALEQLQLAILAGVLNGSLQWPDPKKWFIQSEIDPQFVLLRSWFTLPRKQNAPSS